jgi:putative transposon-encoded protein
MVIGFAEIRKRLFNMPNAKDINKKADDDDKKAAAGAPNSKVKFEIYGEEMIEKRVKSSGNSGRVYLPPNWVGHKVKIIRTD